MLNLNYCFSLKSPWLLRFTLLSIVFLTALLAHSNTADQHSIKLTTLKPKTLTIGTYFTNPPFEFLSNQQPTGFEVDLITEIAQRLGLQSKFVTTQWEKIIDELINHQYDMIMGGITITPHREKIINFSQPYMTTTLSIIINSIQTPQIHQIEDLHNQMIGVQATTTDEDIAKQMYQQGVVKGIKIYPFKQFDVALSDLLAGRIGAVMKVYPVANYYVQRHPSLKILAAVPHAPQPLGFGFNQDNPQLVEAVNKIQSDMQADGTYQKIYQKWLRS